MLFSLEGGLPKKTHVSYPLGGASNPLGSARSLFAPLCSEVTLLWSSGVGSGTDLGLVHRHCGRETATVSGQHAVDLPGYVALQTADDLSFALALLCAP